MATQAVVKQDSYDIVGLYVPTVMIMKITDFWEVTPSILVDKY
jgi:hypothetical protein